MLRYFSTSTNVKSAIKLSKPSLEFLDSNFAQNVGVSGLISKETLDDVWYKQVDSHIEDLQFGIDQSINANLEQIVGEKSSPLNQYHKMMKQTALDPRDSLAFNSASSLYNLNHFFSTLKNNSSNKVAKINRNDLLKTPNYTSIINNPPLDRDLIEKINKSFGSWEEFVTLFLASANSLNGNGFTWLVLRVVESKNETDFFKNTASLAVVNTYNNGTPSELTKGQVSALRKHMSKTVFKNDPKSSEKILSIEEAQEVELYDVIGVPLLGVPSNPSFYLRDYGVFGKRQYLENALSCINWEVVTARFKDCMTSKDTNNKRRI